MPTFRCPQCDGVLPSPFRPPCPSCGFSVDHLTGKSLSQSQFQQTKWNKHNELLYGSGISLHGGNWNASFTNNGNAALDELVRFTISYGDSGTIGPRQHPLRFAYIPEIIGSGTRITTIGTVACSGVCIVSPGSVNYGHGYPVMDDWVQKNFSGMKSSCRLCSRPTSFGEVICSDCYDSNGADWRKFI